MHAAPVQFARKGIVLAALAIGLAGASCQNMNALVTGEQFYRAPEGSARVEVELVVQTDDRFFIDLDESADRERLEAEIAELVLGHADVGMRFYPIPSAEYDEGDARPAYIMFVRVDGMAVNAEHELIEPDEGEPYVESSVRTMDCRVTASVEKRRDDAPPLRVGTGSGKGRVHVGPLPENASESNSHLVQQRADEHQPLRVLHSDVLALVEESVVDALRQVIRPVDRDIALASDSNL